MEHTPYFADEDVSRGLGIPDRPGIDGLPVSHLWLSKVVRVRGQGAGASFLHGPLIYWMHVAFGMRGEAYFLGVSEWGTAALLVAGFWNRKLSLLGSLVCVATFVCTVTIIPFFPSAWASEIGFPGMTLVMGFLMKDVVLLAVSIYMVRQDVIAIAADQEAETVSRI